MTNDPTVYLKQLSTELSQLRARHEQIKAAMMEIQNNYESSNKDLHRVAASELADYTPSGLGTADFGSATRVLTSDRIVAALDQLIQL